METFQQYMHEQDDFFHDKDRATEPGFMGFGGKKGSPLLRTAPGLLGASPGFQRKSNHPLVMWPRGPFVSGQGIMSGQADASERQHGWTCRPEVADHFFQRAWQKGIQGNNEVSFRDRVRKQPRGRVNNFASCKPSKDNGSLRLKSVLVMDNGGRKSNRENRPGLLEHQPSAAAQDHNDGKEQSEEELEEGEIEEDSPVQSAVSKMDSAEDFKDRENSQEECVTWVDGYPKSVSGESEFGSIGKHRHTAPNGDFPLESASLSKRDIAEDFKDKENPQKEAVTLADGYPDSVSHESESVTFGKERQSTHCTRERRLVDRRLNECMELVNHVTVKDAQRSFLSVCRRLRSALSTLCDLSKNLNVQQKGLEDFSVKLTEAVYSTFSGVRAAYAVRSTAIGKEQDQDMDYFPRLLELASGRCRRLFTSKQIQELESMMRNIGLYSKSEPCSTMAVSQASSETLEAKDPNVGDSEVITHTNAEPGIKSESASEIVSNAAILKMRSDPKHVRDMSTAPVSCLGIMGNIPESSNPGDVVIMNKVPETSAALSGIDTSKNCTEITSDDDVRSFQAEHVSHPCSDKNVADPLSAASLYCEKFACKPHLYTRLPSPTPEEKEDAQTECQEGDIVSTAQSNTLLEKLEQDSAPFPVSYRDLDENKQQTDTASHAEGCSIADFGLLSYPDIVQSQSGGSSQLSRNAGADSERSQTSVKAAANEFGTKMSQTSMLLASKITGIEGPKALGVTKQDEGHMKSRDPRRILRGRQAYPDVWVADPENQPADLSSLVFGLEHVGGSRKREREGDIDQENRLVKRQHKDEKLSLQDALIGPPNLPGGRHAEDNKFVETLSEGSTDMEIDSLDSSQQLGGAGNSDETNSKNENFASIFVGEVIVPRKKQKIREIPDLNQECAEAISSNDSGYLNAGNWVAQNTSVVSMQPSACIDLSKIGNTLKPRMKLRDPRRALLETTEEVKNVDRGPPKVDESVAINFKPSSDTVRAETIFLEPASSLPLEHSLLTLSKEKTLRHGNKVAFWGNDKPNGHDSPLLLDNGVSSPLKGNQLKDDAVPSGLNSSRVDGHIDLTQECGIVGDMILTGSRSKPRSNKSRSSKHYPSKVSEGFKCWENLEVFEGLDEEEREAVYQERARRIDEQNRMLNARKLCLVLDLDHTLLNSAKFTEIDEEWEALLHANEAAEHNKVDDNGVSRRELYRFPHMGMWTKLRPGVWDFLSRASELFELHVYTMGNKAYATEMAKLLDPTGTLFAGRVISKGDDGDTFDDDGRLPKSKDLDGVLGMESAVIIIDDSVRVWPHHRHNLIVVERYMYFPSSRRQFGLPGPSLLEIKHDERETDGMLASVLSVIEDIHHTFFANKWIHEVDVRHILAAVKQNVLAGCKILFSRVFPQGESLPHLHPLWQTAEHFGATCTTTLDEDITHVVAMSRGTDKVKWATSTGRFSVSPAWLEASAVLYRRANEFDFPVPQ